MTLAQTDGPASDGPATANCTPDGNPVPPRLALSVLAQAESVMSKRSKASVDFQFLLGDTLIKTGAALVWLTILIGLYTPFTLGDAIRDGMVGYVGMIAGILLFAVGLWQWGRNVRREATIADR